MASSHESICTFSRGLNWHTFDYLENRLLETSRYVTFDPQNINTWSENFADLLILCGSAVDTFFRNMIDCPTVKTSLSSPHKRKKKINH